MMQKINKKFKIQFLKKKFFYTSSTFVKENMECHLMYPIKELKIHLLVYKCRYSPEICEGNAIKCNNIHL